MPKYHTPPGSSVQPIVDAIKENRRQMRDAQRPSGTNLSSLVAQVQTALVNINASVIAAIAANSYTQAQINAGWYTKTQIDAGWYTKGQTDSKVANPGNITPATVVASGTLRADAGLYSTDAYSFNITGTRVTGWHQIDGHIGTASSSERFKTNIVDADLIAKAEAILACQVDYYNYKAEIAKRDDPTSPEYIGPDYQVHTELGMIAERLHEAGLWEFVVYERDVVMKSQTVVDEEGNESVVEVYAGDTLRLNADGEPIPYSIHYEIFSLAVLTAAQYLYGLWKIDHAQLEQNTNAIAAIRAQLGI